MFYSFELKNKFLVLFLLPCAALTACGGDKKSDDGEDGSMEGSTSDAGDGSMLELPDLIVCPAGATETDCNYVGGDGIQEAIEASTGTAEDKTIILVRTGTYTRQQYEEYSFAGDGAQAELGRAFILVANKYVTLRAEEGTTFDGNTSEKMNGVVATSGEIEVQNVGIGGFHQSEQACYDTVPLVPCSWGVGVFALETGKITLTNVKVQANDYYGVGLFNEGSVTMDRSEVFGHSYSTGVLAYDRSSLTVTNSKLYNNVNNAENFSANGIYATDTATVAVSNSLIYDNESSAFYFDGTATATVSNNVIYDNGGAGVYLSSFSTATITNNTIHHNRWAGVYVYSCLYMGDDCNPAATVINNVITETQLDDQGLYGYAIGGGCISDQAKLANDTYNYNLQWNNAGASTACGGNHSCADLNNLSQDPKYTNASTQDFRLQTGSPAIDSGNPTAAYNDPDGTRSDRGAYGGPAMCAEGSPLTGC